MGEVAPARIMISVQLRAAPNSAAARAHEPHRQLIHHEANGAPRQGSAVGRNAMQANQLEHLNNLSSHRIQVRLGRSHLLLARKPMGKVRGRPAPHDWACDVGNSRGSRSGPLAAGHD